MIVVTTSKFPASPMEPYKLNLQWINIRDPTNVKDEETQTVVKSHVMREFRREERWNLSRSSSALPSQNPSTVDLMSQLDQSQTSPGESLRATYPGSFFSSSFSTEVQEHFGCLSRPLGQSAPSHEDIARSLAAQHRVKVSSSPPPLQIDDVRFIRTQEWPDTSALLQYCECLVVSPPSATDLLQQLPDSSCSQIRPQAPQASSMPMSTRGWRP